MPKISGRGVPNDASITAVTIDDEEITLRFDSNKNPEFWLSVCLAKDEILDYLRSSESLIKEPLDD